MSYIKIEKIVKETVETPEEGHVYFGYDDGGFWKKDDNGSVSYILEGISSAPAILSFVPAQSAFIGDTIIINGANFIGSDISVTFETFLGINPIIVNPFQLKVTIPIGVSTNENIPVVVKTLNGESQPSNYIVQFKDLHPVIIAYPYQGASIGDTITINGANFVPGDTTAYFNNSPGVTNVISSTQLNVVIPNITTGFTHIQVSTSNGLSNDVTLTIYPNTKPIFTSFTQSSGAIGATIDIIGENLNTNQIPVDFGSTPASAINYLSSTHITATIATGTTFGLTSIRVNNIVLPGFTVLGTPSSFLPTITNITPSDYGVGQTVTISGTNFTDSTIVTFGGVLATPSNIQSTSFSATILNDTVFGYNSVIVTNQYGSSLPFSYNIPSVLGATTITSISPTSQYKLNEITISGTNFDTGSANLIYIGGVLSSSTQIVSNQIKCILSSATPSGVVDVKIENSHGKYIMSGFTVLTSGSIPTISSVSPVFGKGGDTVDIIGLNLSDCNISFGNSYPGVSESTTHISSTHLQAVIPSGLLFAGNSRLMNIYATGTNGTYTYSSIDIYEPSINPPILSSFTPQDGLIGSEVTINGANFSEYWFDAYISIISGTTKNDILLANQSFVSNNQIKGKIPYTSGYFGPASLKVVTPIGSSEKIGYTIQATTTTTTTAAPIVYYTYYLASSPPSGGPYTSPQVACSNSSSSIPYGYLYSNVSGLTAGSILYTNSGLTTGYVGNDSYIAVRHVGNTDIQTFRVYSSGVIHDNPILCSSYTTTTTTAAPIYYTYLRRNTGASGLPQDACSSTGGPYGQYYSSSSTLSANSTFLYSDVGLTTPAPSTNGQYVVFEKAGSGVYQAVILYSSGMVNSIVNCSSFVTTTTTTIAPVTTTTTTIPTNHYYAADRYICGLCKRVGINVNIISTTPISANTDHRFYLASTGDVYRINGYGVSGGVDVGDLTNPSISCETIACNLI